MVLAPPTTHVCLWLCVAAFLVLVSADRAVAGAAERVAEPELPQDLQLEVVEEVADDSSLQSPTNRKDQGRLNIPFPAFPSRSDLKERVTSCMKTQRLVPEAGSGTGTLAETAHKARENFEMCLKTTADLRKFYGCLVGNQVLPTVKLIIFARCVRSALHSPGDSITPSTKSAVAARAIAEDALATTLAS